MTDDVSLALAPVLTANQHIDHSFVGSWVKIKKRGSTDKHGFLAAAVRRNDNIRDFGELLDITFCPVSLQLVVGNRVIVDAFPCFVALFQFFVCGCQMDMVDIGSICSSYRVDLT